MSEARFPGAFQLEVQRPDSPDVPEVQTAGKEIVLSSKEDELFVELTGRQIRDLVTVHVRQGAVVRQYNYTVRRRKVNKLSIGKAADFTDGMLTVVVHAYVKVLDYYRMYYKQDIAGLKKIKTEASSSAEREQAEQELRAISEGLAGYDPKQYGFLPYILTWNIRYQLDRAAEIPLPTRSEAEQLRKDNEEMRRRLTQYESIAERADLEADEDKLKDEIKKRREQNRKLSGQLDALRGETETAQQEIDRLSNEKDDLTEERDRALKQKEDMLRQAEARAQERDRQAAELAALQGEIAQIREKEEALKDLSDQVDALRKAEDENKKRRTQLKGSITKLGKEIELLKKEHGDLKEQLRQAEEQLSLLPEKRRELEEVRTAYERDSDQFIDTLISDLKGRRIAERDIDDIVDELQTLETWHFLTDQTRQRMQELNERLSRLREDFRNLQWTAEQERNRAQ